MVAERITQTWGHQAGISRLHEQVSKERPKFFPTGIFRDVTTADTAARGDEVFTTQPLQKPGITSQDMPSKGNESNLTLAIRRSSLRTWGPISWASSMISIGR